MRCEQGRAVFLPAARRDASHRCISLVTRRTSQDPQNTESPLSLPYSSAASATRYRALGREHLAGPLLGKSETRSTFPVTAYNPEEFQTGAAVRVAFTIQILKHKHLTINTFEAFQKSSKYSIERNKNLEIQ